MTIYDKSTFFVINTVIYEMKRVTFNKTCFFVFVHHKYLFKKVLTCIFLYKKGGLNEYLIVFILKLHM